MSLPQDDPTSRLDIMNLNLGTEAGTEAASVDYSESKGDEGDAASSTSSPPSSSSHNNKGKHNQERQRLQAKDSLTTTTTTSSTPVSSSPPLDESCCHEHDEDSVVLHSVEHESLSLDGSHRERSGTGSSDRSRCRDNYEPWFYPEMSREEANTSLSKYSSVDGVFLVRSSQRSPGTYVLSFTYRGKINHVSIQHVEADHGQTVCTLDWGQTRFYDLNSLIEFYQLNQGHGSGSLPTRLTHFLVHR